MDDVLIVGGGVIGLSLAWDLARNGARVRVIDQGEMGREASWAGAGILPPATRTASQHPAEQLRGLACELHPRWAEALKSITSIDTGYRRCGGLYLARSAGEGAALAAWAAALVEEGIEAVSLSAAEVREIEAGVALPGAGNRLGEVGSQGPGARSQGPVLGSSNILLPGEAQLRNPRHLKALLAACARSGVTISPHVAAGEIEIAGGEVCGIATSAGQLRARQYCFTAGAWTGQILQRLGISAGIMPIRGQIVLFQCERPPITRIVNAGARYLVPREDGYVLAGSTEEEAGFDKRTTAEAIRELTEFAGDVVPALRQA